MSNSQTLFNEHSPCSGGSGGGEHGTGSNTCSNPPLFGSGSSSSHSINNGFNNTNIPNSNTSNINASASSSTAGHPSLALMAHTTSTAPAAFPTMNPGFHATSFPYYNTLSPAGPGNFPIWTGMTAIMPQLIPLAQDNYDNALNGQAWHARNAELVVCVVCGGICKSVNLNPSAAIDQSIPSWMQAALLRPKVEYLEWQNQKQPTKSWIRKGAELIELIDVTFFLGGSRGMKVSSKPMHINTLDPMMKIPVHRACFEMAQHFCKVQSRYSIDFRNPDGGAPSNISHLYEIWCKRAIASGPRGRMTKPILEANMYLGAPLISPVSKYLEAIEKHPSLSCFLACPLGIPKLTDIVVNSRIQTMDCKRVNPRAYLAQLWRRCQDLPQELLDIVLSFVDPFDENGGPPLQPTRVLPPAWWKEQLLSGKLIPWLWDLSTDDVVTHRVNTYYKDNRSDWLKDQSESRYVFDENMWDWELLCRQLAQANVVEEGGLLEGAPKELWNRHRIWKLLDAARLGHVAFPG